MKKFRQELDANLTTLAWSLWTELGVRGVVRNHQNCIVDPEALIIYTAALGDIDPRLRDESIDWCINYWRFIAAARLKNIWKQQSKSIQNAFAQYAATINDHCWSRWPLPKRVESYRVSPSNKSLLPDLKNQSLVNLRLRGLFGVGARAEIFSALLAEPNVGISAADLAKHILYTKRNTMDILDGLQISGIVKTKRHGNQLRYQLEQQTELIKLIGPFPSRFPKWVTIFNLLLQLRLFVEHISNESKTVAGVEAAKFLKTVKEQLEELGIRFLPQKPSAEIFFNSFTEWVFDFTETIAKNK